MADDGDGPRPELEEAHAPPAHMPRFARQAMLLLKAANLSLITFYSFGVIYVLVRVIDPAFYPWIVFITAIGNYILASDLGFGGHVYASLRRSFLSGGIAAESDFVSDALNAYFHIAIGSAIAAAGVVAVALRVDPAMKAAIALYFAAIVLALPWSLIRRVAASIDAFLAMEAIEFARRLATVALAALMLAGLSFLAFAALSLLLWLFAFAAALLLLRRRGAGVRLATPARALRFIIANKRHVYATGKLTGFEFAIYNHPYLVLPLVLGDAAAVVSYDVFYKFLRFGGVAYGVAVETFLPSQTRAYYAGDMRAVRRFQWVMVSLQCAPFLAAALFLTVFGQAFMTGLLSSAHPVEPGLRFIIIVMLAAILLQTTASATMVAVGRYDELGDRAAITAALMALGALATWMLRLSFTEFLLLYAAAYLVHTAMFQTAFRRHTRPPDLAGASLARSANS